METEPGATEAAAGNITVIDRKVVHTICSGQVVLSLATAVKELVENSLDAGASVVEVRLQEFGSALVEVIDNGSGVQEKNFEALTVKHATSKLRQFSDLFSVETFGFRGEALSSLCALAELSVSTRHQTASLGTNLVYDQQGGLVKREAVSRQIGTTVTLANLFASLPVRRKEFLRNLKREYSKMMSVVSGYGLVSRGVKLSVVQMGGRGRGRARTVLLQTAGLSTRDNLVSIFGAKQAVSLLPFKQAEMTGEELSAAGLPEHVPAVTLAGFVSSPQHGEGRGCPDRQFYFVNSRPCEPPKLSKLVNQVYHGYNRQQFPFVCLNILTERATVDINITPDKRQIYLTNEKYLVLLMKKSLEKMFADEPSTMRMNSFLPSFEISSVKPAENSDITSLKRSLEVTERVNQTVEADPGQKRQKTMQSFFTVSPSGDSCSSEKRFTNPPSSASIVRDNEEKNQTNMKLKKSEDFKKASVDKRTLPTEATSHNKENLQVDENTLVSDSGGFTLIFDDFSARKDENISNGTHTQEQVEINENKTVCESPILDDFTMTSNKKTNYENEESKRVKFGREFQGICPESNRDAYSSNQFKKENGCRQKKRVEATFNFDMLIESLKIVEQFSSQDDLNFRAEIKPSDNCNAEKELKKQLQKEDFSHMKIVGQFNLGFIITRLGYDLFIIDQHATDEKYNFETLQKTTTIKSQQMVVPKRLELTAVNESILMENLPVFEKNGFQFRIDSEAPCTEKVKLVSVPMSKNWTFGKDDIDELLFLLSEGGAESLVGAMQSALRPSRVRAMFASRACRTSVMVGTALASQDMERLVRHMGHIDQPWNCPHGRPTIRHLVNTALLRHVSGQH